MVVVEVDLVLDQRKGCGMLVVNSSCSNGGSRSCSSSRTAIELWYVGGK